MNKKLVIFLVFVFAIKGIFLEYYINNERYMLLWDYKSDKVIMSLPIEKEVIIPNLVKQHWKDLVYDENCKYFKYCFEYGSN